MTEPNSYDKPSILSRLRVDKRGTSTIAHTTKVDALPLIQSTILLKKVNI